MSSSFRSFKLSEYDVIGFDFDGTILQYNLTNLFPLQYKFTADYLIKTKGYTTLSPIATASDIDFVRRGLFMDLNRGNILNISANGKIIEASHGTKKLSLNDIITIYGEERKWPEAKKVIQSISKGEVINGPINGVAFFVTFFDCLSGLLFGKLVDIAGLGGNMENYNQFYKHVDEAINSLYTPSSDFFNSLKDKKFELAHKCDAKFIEWLRILKQKHKLLLISGGRYPLVNSMAKTLITPEWQELFDTIICEAEKPVFFSGSNTFKNVSGEQVELNTYKGAFRNGNWKDLHSALSKEIGRNAKCVYMGDDIAQDLCGALSSNCSGLDAVAIVEESLIDGFFPNNRHPHEANLKSNFWGSLFKKDGSTTFYCDLVREYSILCIPLLKYLADFPTDHEHFPFWSASAKVQETNI